MEILLTWVGSRDPTWLNNRTKKIEPGPILSLLQHRKFDTVYLLLNLDSKVNDFRQRATDVLRLCGRYFPSIQVKQIPIDVVSVTDYRELFRVMNNVCQKLLHDIGSSDCQYYVYLSPGTPQMQTIWVLLVQSGLLPAKMIDATPPDLVTPGDATWREVELTLPDFPQVVSPEETSRLIGVLQAQNDNFAAENKKLHSDLELLRAGAQISDGTITWGFQLRDYLLTQERALYVQALDQSEGKAAEAARLLGVDPAAFRARAVTLGVRGRRRERDKLSST